MSFDAAKFNAAQTPFIVKTATPKFEASTKPASQQSTAEQVRSVDNHVAETQNVDQQQQVLKTQQTAANTTRPPNIFAAAFAAEAFGGSKFKNPLSDRAYKNGATASARNTAPAGFGIDFGNMAAQLSADGGPSDAIKNMSARLDFFSNPHAQEGQN